MLKKLSYPSYLVLWTVCLSIVVGILVFPALSSNMIRMIRSFKTGVESQTTPPPLYGFMHPGVNKPTCKDFTFGVDFGLIYYNSKQFYKGDIYSTADHDIYLRPLLYPPILCYLYNKTICHLAFPQAVLWHLSIQILLLLLASFFVLNYYRLGFMIIPTALTYFILLFLTPVGLTWIERGQSDLYSALAILFFMFAVYESKAYAFILSAFFVSLKPTISPLFIQAFTLYLLVEFNYKKLTFFVLFIAVILLTLLLFPHYSIAFLALVYKTRLSLVEGITLVRRMPDTVIFLIPFLSLFVYLIPLCLNPGKGMFLKTFLPYSTGLVAINILLTFTSWEYRILSFLGFFPMMIAWFKLYGWEKVYKKEIVSYFLIFLFVAFHGFWIINATPPKWEYFIAAYIAYYLAVAVVSIARINNSSLH